LTVDVAPAEYDAWQRVLRELAVGLEVPRVSGQDGLRSLIRRVLVDEAARAQLERDLAGQ
jgi:hypothetical protein